MKPAYSTRSTPKPGPRPDPAVAEWKTAARKWEARAKENKRRYEASEERVSTLLLAMRRLLNQHHGKDTE